MRKQRKNLYCYFFISTIFSYKARILVFVKGYAHNRYIWKYKTQKKLKGEIQIQVPFFDSFSPPFLVSPVLYIAHFEHKNRKGRKVRPYLRIRAIGDGFLFAEIEG
ncbi:hypothetical protein V6Z11_A05G162900 [Gossypium hirsutum]